VAYDLVGVLRRGGGDSSRVCWAAKAGKTGQSPWADGSNFMKKQDDVSHPKIFKRWAPTSDKWSYNPSDPFTRPFIGIVSPFITSRGPCCKWCFQIVFSQIFFPNPSHPEIGEH